MTLATPRRVPPRLVTVHRGCRRVLLPPGHLGSLNDLGFLLLLWPDRRERAVPWSLLVHAARQLDALETP